MATKYLEVTTTVKGGLPVDVTACYVNDPEGGEYSDIEIFWRGKGRITKKVEQSLTEWDWRNIVECLDNAR